MSTRKCLFWLATMLLLGTLDGVAQTFTKTFNLGGSFNVSAPPLSGSSGFNYGFFATIK